MRHTRPGFWLLFALATTLPASLAEEPAREFSFVVKICEAPKFSVLLSDQTKSKWSECDVPLPGIPVRAFTDGGERFEAATDKQGIAKIPTISLGPEEKARLSMACTTHRCLSLRGLFPGNNLLDYGENRVLVYTPKREGEGGQPGGS